MASNRISRIDEDLQRELSALMRRAKDPRLQQGLFTITGVETTGDLRYAKVYYSVLGEVDEKELRKGLKSIAPWLRRELGNVLTLRYTPELLFERDLSMERGQRLSEVIRDLERKNGEDEDQ